jgi:hypothetical protein
MSKRFSTSWWSSLGFGKRSDVVENDFADMGTAFGLDASMETLPATHDAGATDGDAGHPLTDGSGRHRNR